MGDAALDTRSASAFQNLDEAGADRAISFSFPHHPYAISLLLKISDGSGQKNSAGWD